MITNIFDCHLYLCICLYGMWNIYQFQLFLPKANECFFFFKFKFSFFRTNETKKKPKNFMTVDVIWYIFSLSVILCAFWMFWDTLWPIRYCSTSLLHRDILLRCVFSSVLCTQRTAHWTPNMVNMMKIPIEWRYGSS